MLSMLTPSIPVNTVILQVAVRFDPSVVDAVITVLPSFRTLTKPSSETLAITSSELDQMTALLVASSGFTLKFGINDLNHSATIGTVDSEDISTFYGAWNAVMSYLTENYPLVYLFEQKARGSNLDIIDSSLCQ